ncbi:hypothetical protein LSH36_660g03034 [Paralvinella palmiformis]|uniref:Cyclic nucleotide-binding domain-containing protein n=1 Tax=Paralvinella palmiformis TaxID=53620 RepID=A0AAD9J3M1_9ANNE|nr:hypothetical protein LSH36_660g03034 [Paralvinella palmiformis]
MIPRDKWLINAAIHQDKSQLLQRELALVTHKPRAASAYAVGIAKCAVLDVGAFERLLGPCMDIMKRNIEGYEEQLVQIFGSKAEIGQLR